MRQRIHTYHDVLQSNEDARRRHDSDGHVRRGAVEKLLGEEIGGGICVLRAGGHIRKPEGSSFLVLGEYERDKGRERMAEERPRQPFLQGNQTYPELGFVPVFGESFHRQRLLLLRAGMPLLGRLFQLGKLVGMSISFCVERLQGVKGRGREDPVQDGKSGRATM